MLTVWRAEPPGTGQTKKPPMRENSLESGTEQGFLKVLSEKLTAERTKNEKLKQKAD